ncbi:MAG: CBS domain-containing protein [Chloroflexota bacterium]
MLKIAEIMDRMVVSIPSSASVIEAAQQMKACGNGIIPVCDDGRFRGVITERDIVVGIIAQTLDPAAEKVFSVMKNNIPAVSPDDDIWHAANMMVDNSTLILPVVDRGNLVGLFTLEDFARESPALAAMVFTKKTMLQFSREVNRSPRVNGGHK